MISNAPSRPFQLAFDKVVVVGHEDTPRYRALRLRGLQEHPEAFGETAEGFRARSDQQISERIRSQTDLGAFILAAVSKTGEMLGLVGLALSEPGKSRHRGMLWGMYVRPECRGQQIGQFLIQDLLARAERIEGLEQIHLSVVTTNQSAISLYKNMGFTTYGTDPRVLKVGEQPYDEYLMVRMLSCAGGAT